MSNNHGYKKQQNLSSVQLLSELPTFIESVLSAVFSGALLLYVDLLDSLSYIIRYTMVMLLSKKLSKDLRFEYNYGVEKIEAISSLFCDGIVLCGMFLTVGFAIYSLFYPSTPSDLLIGVAGLKLYDIIWDLAFFIKQRKIYQSHRTAVIETNYAAARGALLFDVFTFVALLLMWVLRSNPIGGYISPVVSIFVAVYLMAGCFKHIRTSLSDLTDKTLPEEMQMKILNILIRFYNSYSQVFAINSHKSGDLARVDLYLAFEKSTSAEEIVDLKMQMQEEFDKQIGNCNVNIIVGDE